MQPTNQQQQSRGVQGRPDIKAREKFGEERVAELLREKKDEITALFANDPRPDAMYERAYALSIGAYRKIQKDSDDLAASQNKAPQRINEESTVANCLAAMQRKLDPGTDVYFVPYSGKVTSILSPEGVIKLLFRSGLVKAINARYVFHGEEFDYELGSKQWVKHKKNNARPKAEKTRGQVSENVAEWNALTHAYAIIDLKDGGQTIEVLDKADIAYFKSLSPTGESPYGGWAKFPAAFGRKAALKQAAKFVPKESEVSIILTADDTDRGLEIPDEIMKAVGARMLGDMTGEVGNAGSAPAGAGDQPPVTQHSKKPAGRQAPLPGNSQQIRMPGKAPQPTIYEAPHEMVIEAEGRMRESFDKNSWNDKFWNDNALQLATLRQEMRERNLEVQPHPFFDSVLETVPAGNAGGEMREPGMEG